MLITNNRVLTSEHTVLRQKATDEAGPSTSDGLDDVFEPQSTRTHHHRTRSTKAPAKTASTESEEARVAAEG